MLKFQATYRMAGQQDFFSDIVRYSFIRYAIQIKNQTKENFRVGIWVFELTEPQVKAMQEAITDPELKKFVTDADKPAKTVSLFLRQVENRLPKGGPVLVNVIQVHEEMPAPAPTIAELLKKECDDPDCHLHNPGNPINKDPWGYR